MWTTSCWRMSPRSATICELCGYRIAAAMSTVPPATIVVIGDPSGMTARRIWTFLTDAASGVVTLANLPTAVVTRLSDAEVRNPTDLYHVVELTDDVDHPEYVCDLKPAFCYTRSSPWAAKRPSTTGRGLHDFLQPRRRAQLDGAHGELQRLKGSPFFMAGMSISGSSRRMRSRPGSRCRCSTT